MASFPHNYMSKQIKRLCRQYFKIPYDSIIFTYSTINMESFFKYKDTLPDSLCECSILV